MTRKTKQEKAPPPKPPALPALSLVGSTRFTYTLSIVLIIVVILFILGLLFIPWRQNVRGAGKVIAFDPLERRINVEAQLAGRVKVLNIVEGQEVQKGELIAEIENNDPLLMENLKSQREATRNRKKLAENKVDEIKVQLEQLLLAKSNAITIGEEKVKAAQIKLKTIELEHTRTSSLFEKGLSSRREFEQIEMKRKSAQADLTSAESSLRKIDNDFEGSLSALRAQERSARADVQTATKDIIGYDIQVNQTDRQQIFAPQDGIVYAVMITDGTYLTPGRQICTIIPKTESRYVELWLDGNDIGLIKARKEKGDSVTEGSQVRLSFEGWPSIQAVGWPNLAIGTFGGEVVFIDSANDGTGRFRVVVGPKLDKVTRYNGEGKVEVGWPDKDRWLRQGTLTQAWFLLEDVPLWMELWRKMNGFPPLAEDDGTLNPTKKPKKKKKRK